MKISESKDKLKVGDWVRTNGDGSFDTTSCFFEGEIGEIQENKFFVWQDEKNGIIGNMLPSTKGYKYSWMIGFDNSSAEIEILKRNGEVYYETSSIISEPIKKTMNKLTSMLKRLLDADAQTLYKAGYINGDLELTERGKKALESIVFDANKAALVNMAQDELDEEKEDKK